MSHNRSPEFGFVKFDSDGVDTFTVVHNLNDLRPVVDLYNEATELRIPDDEYSVEVIDNNTIEIVLSGILSVRGTVIGFPEPGE